MYVNLQNDLGHDERAPNPEREPVRRARFGSRRRWATLRKAPLHFSPPRDSRMGGRLYPAAIALSTLLLGLTSSVAPRAAIIAASGVGAMYVLRQRWAALLISVVMLLSLAVVPAARTSAAWWSLTLLTLFAATATARRVPRLLHVSHWTWASSMVLAALCLILSLTPFPLLANVAMAAGAICAAYLGAGLARNLAMADARLLSWDEEGLIAVTRDLLLGRITDGMLHDLAQPLNVIAMANSNVGYIIEHLDIPSDGRQQLTERIERIASHTEGAADVLALFRSLGREKTKLDGERAAAFRDQLTVRRALERAIAATRSTVRHHVSISLTGNALDHHVSGHGGSLEILGVAALLSAYGAFVDDAGNKLKGTVLLRAELSPAHVVVHVWCIDESGACLACRPLDAATFWLVEQVAREGGGDFTCMPRSRPTKLVLRLARDEA